MAEYLVGEHGPEVFTPTREKPVGMRIVVDYPPNIASILLRFRVSEHTIFAWGDVLYVPSGGEVEPDVMAHELVHKRQQEEFGGPAEWWLRYLTDSAFVLEQEIPAYQRQFAVFCGLHRNRGQQIRRLAQLSGDLSGPMYGRLIDFRRASTLIRGGKAR